MSTEPRKPVVLAEETQEFLTQDQIKREDLAIDESFSPSQSYVEKLTNKRKLLEDSSEIAAKRQATGNSGDDEDSFNFINEATNVNAAEKKLNLLRAPKRKASVDCDEEDLFNFHTESDPKEKKSRIFNKNGDEENGSVNKRPKLEEKQDIKPIRGIDLKEISAIGVWKLCIKTEIKQEFDADELNNKLDSMNIGSSVVVIKDDLIKKEVVEVVEPPSNGVVNFKKFKKVWPLSMQGPRSNA